MPLFVLSKHGQRPVGGYDGQSGEDALDPAALGLSSSDTVGPWQDTRSLKDVSGPREVMR